MRRRKQDKHSDSYWVDENPDCNKSLFHSIKYHPLLCHFFDRLAYKRDGHEKNDEGTVPVLSTDSKKEVKHVTRKSNVEKKMTPNSSIAKDSLRNRIKAIVSKEISKKRSRNHRNSACSRGTINMNKNLVTFVKDPVSPLAYHHHKQQVYGSEIKLTRSVSFPIPDSTVKRPTFGAIGNGSLQKEKAKSCFDNKKPNLIQFESSDKFYVRSMSSGAKCFNVDEATIVKDVNCCSGSSPGQNQNEIKQFKNLKQKIDYVTGESRKEKVRVAMDAVIDKLPQGYGISDDLKKEIFKKLTDPGITRKGEDYPESTGESDLSTPSFSKNHKHKIRRIWSLPEPLEIYHQLYENRFNTELSHFQSRQLKLGTRKEDLPLRMLIPLQRMHSLPDLQSFFYAYEKREFPDISSVTEPTMASGNETMSSENISSQIKMRDLNLNSKSQLQLDSPVANLIQKHLVSVAENDLVISNNVEPGLDCSLEIDGKVGMTTDDFGQICLKGGGTYNDQGIGRIEEYKIAIAASVDSKSNSGPRDKLDNMGEEQEASMNSLNVKEAAENAPNVEIQSKQLNHDIPLFDVDTRDKADYNYVRFILEISGLTGKESHSAWHSNDHPVDPLLYEEMEGDPDFCSYGDSGQCNHHVMFDLINETLLEISGRSCCCPKPLASSISHTHPMPKGCHILHQVWTHMSKTLCLRSKNGLTIDDHVSRDLDRRDGWLNPLLFDQCVGLELEDLIFHDLLEEITCDLACIKGSY